MYDRTHERGNRLVRPLGLPLYGVAVQHLEREERMRRMRWAIGTVVGVLNAVLVVWLSWYAVTAFFCTRVGLPVTDGLGRTLCPCPWILRLIFGADRLWAGWIAATTDLAILLGGAILVLAVGVLAGWLRGAAEPHPNPRLFDSISGENERGE